MGTTLGGLAGGDPARFGALAAMTALLVAAVGFLAWAARAGAVVHFISESVMLGFKAGVALHLASTQLPKLFGMPAGHGGDFWERMAAFLRHVGATNPASLATGLAALGLLVAGKIWLPHRPVALFIVAAGIAAAPLADLAAHGVKLLGEVPAGLPAPSWPGVGAAEVRELLPLALACFLLGAVETAAIGRMFAEKHGYRLDSNQEFLALAGANLASGLGHGFPVSGGMSQSLVNESAGARTSLSGLVAALVVGGVALCFTGVLRHLPQPVLAAIVLMAVAGLVRVRELRHLWTGYRMEFWVAMAALSGVLWAGLLKGVLLGAAISIVLLLRRASAPHVAFLGRIPGVARFSDLERHPNNERIPGLLAFRVESGLIYFNAAHVMDTVLARVDGSAEPVRLVVWDLSTSAYVDLSGARMVLALHGELAKRGIALRVVEAHASVRDVLRREAVDHATGGLDRVTSLAQVVEAFERGAADQGPSRMR
jgi:MFS superfamily sulfate permease-like transporter